ncbi:MAG TPA: hypothetical protein VGO93_08380 [Candidatus Xenobia bacterium]
MATPPAGLCETCTWARRIENDRASVFWLCGHPDLVKYPRLPVLSCSGYAS